MDQLRAYLSATTRHLAIRKIDGELDLESFVKKLPGGSQFDLNIILSCIQAKRTQSPVHMDSGIGG